MARQDIHVDTADGVCPAAVFSPDRGDPPWPGVLFFMDGVGIRPTLWDMAREIAEDGYLVLLPDLYYRSGPYPRMDPVEVFSDDQAKEAMFELYHSLHRERVITDARAFVAWLDADQRVRGPGYAAVGYCMGGRCALTAAGALPDRFALVAAFHAGHLATDAADSPHRHLSGIRGFVYVAGAIEDKRFTAAQKAELEHALCAAGIGHRVETYPHARHGFAVPDMRLYNPDAARQHRRTLHALLEATLGPPPRTD